MGRAQILLSHGRYQDYHLQFFTSINSMSNTLYVLRNSNMRVMRNEVYMSTFHNSRSYSWFQYCVVDFKMKWSLSGCVVWKPWPVISLLNAVRWQLLLSVRQTRSKIKSCLLKCFQHCNIPNYREKNWYDVKRERDWAVKRKAVSLMTKVIILSLYFLYRYSWHEK